MSSAVVAYLPLLLIVIASSTTIICDESNPCINQTDVSLQCVDEEECTVQCMTANACDNAQITCPRNNDCTLICNEMCSNIQILSATTTENMNIHCLNSSCQSLIVNASNVANLRFTEHSNSDHSYTASSITIHAENVKNSTSITCLGDYACNEAIIYAEHSNQLQVTANGANVLHFATIYAQHVSSFTLSCISLDQTGCNNPSLYLPISPSSNIAVNCIGVGCQSLVLYTMNGFSDIDSLSLDGCNTCTNIGGDESDDCIFEWSVHCGSQYSQSSTIWGSYCSDDECGCMHYGLNLMESAWQTTDLLCDAYADPPLVFGDYVDYDIDCSVSTYTCNAGGDVTTATLMNGVRAKSLNITCASNQDCGPLVVYCPEHGECNIHCNGDESCQGASVYNNHGNELHIYCTQSSSCKAMEVHAFNASGVLVECLAENACHSVKVFATKADRVHFLCDSDAVSDTYLSSPCYAVEIYGEYANSVELECNSAYACFATYLYAENAQNLWVSAQETHGLYEPHVYAQNVDSFTLQCVGNVEYDGCYQPRLWIDGSNTHINCVGFGCEYMMITMSDDAESVSAITMRGQCDACNSIDSCVGQWQLSCGQQQDYLNGDECESNECGCDLLRSKLRNGWMADAACIGGDDANNTNHASDGHVGEQTSKGGVALWLTVIAVVLSIAIVFTVIMCFRSWFIKKQQQHHLRQINLVRLQQDEDKIKEKERTEDRSDDGDGGTDEDEEIAKAAPMSSMSASSNLGKEAMDAEKPNAPYKKMVDQLDHFDFEEGR